MTDITLKLSIEETNLIMEGLGNLPFVRVHNLIRAIHEQADQQMQGETPTCGNERSETLSKNSSETSSEKLVAMVDE